MSRSDWSDRMASGRNSIELFGPRPVNKPNAIPNGPATLSKLPVLEPSRNLKLYPTRPLPIPANTLPLQPILGILKILNKKQGS